jgi:hypothetical protein
MQLLSFQLLDLTTLTVLANLDGPIAMPDIRPGNGMGDYLISGFNLTGVNAGDRIAFRAQFSGATDGPDSFYLVAAPDTPGTVPEPAAFGLMAAGLIGIGVFRRRIR